MQHARSMLVLVRLFLVVVLGLGILGPRPIALWAQEGDAAWSGADAPSFEDQAAQITSDIVAGRFADVRARFDPTMSDLLSEAGLANAWRTYQELLGPFESAGEPTTTRQGELTIARVPVHLAARDGEIRVVFHPDGTLAGLFFLCAGGARC